MYTIQLHRVSLFCEAIYRHVLPVLSVLGSNFYTITRDELEMSYKLTKHNFDADRTSIIYISFCVQSYYHDKCNKCYNLDQFLDNYIEIIALTKKYLVIRGSDNILIENVMLCKYNPRHKCNIHII